MRLIDELLKDDFFHGGYQPGAVTVTTAADTAPSGGSKKLILIAAGVVVLLAAAGGAGYFFLSQKPSTAGPDSQQAQKLAAVVPPAPPAAVTPEPVSQVAAPAPISQETASAATADVAAAPIAEAAPSAPVEEAAAKVAEPAPTPQAAPVESKDYVLVFPTMTDKKAVDRLLGQLKEQGIKASAKQSTTKTTVYRVVGVKPVPSAEANAVKLKASIFKVPANYTENGNGTVSFDFGSYATPEEAREAAGNVQKLGIDIKLGRSSVDQPAYTVSSAALTKADAEKHADGFKASGLAPSLSKVP